MKYYVEEDKNLELMGLSDDPAEFAGNDGEWHVIPRTDKCLSEVYPVEDGPLPF